MGLLSVFAVLAVAATAASPPAAQTPAGDLRWFVAVEGADTMPGQTRAYRIYDVGGAVRLSLSVFNESDTAALIDVADFVSGMELQVTGRADLPFQAELEAVQGSGIPRQTRAPAGRVRVGPNSRITFHLLLRPDDGTALAAGEYAIALDLARSADTIEDSSRRRWPGQFLRRATMTLFIAPPKDSAERVAKLAFEAHNALTENDLPAAETLLLRALQEGPNQSLSCALGNLYVVQGRYREAIDTYEQASTGFGARDPQLLALAYVGTGAEHAAVATLRAGGWSEARIEEEMRLLRGIVARRAGSLQ
jgi:hypothetical protein